MKNLKIIQHLITIRRFFIDMADISDIFWIFSVFGSTLPRPLKALPKFPWFCDFLAIFLVFYQILTNYLMLLVEGVNCQMKEQLTICGQEAKNKGVQTIMHCWLMNQLLLSIHSVTAMVKRIAGVLASEKQVRSQVAHQILPVQVLQY